MVLFSSRNYSAVTGVGIGAGTMAGIVTGTVAGTMAGIVVGTIHNGTMTGIVDIKPILYGKSYNHL